MLKHQIARKIG